MSRRMRQLRGTAYLPPKAIASGRPSTGRFGYYENPAWGGLLRGSMAGSVDATTRKVILRMQPKDREELLQSMREQGPEGYHQFIQDYFNRLAKARQSKGE